MTGFSARGWLVCLFVVATPVVNGSAADEISFNRDIRPILSENCFACHGPDKRAREADRRLDTLEGALADNDGIRAIVPGDLAKSELWLRVSSSDRDEVMPPPKSEKKLNPAQIALLKRWIEQGAKYESHWAFIPPQRPRVPGNAEFELRIAEWEKRDSTRGAELRARVAELAQWPRNPIDNFILERLLREGLTPSAQASPEMLVRRLHYDLTGLPPTLEEMELGRKSAISNQQSAITERLLASPRYGEKLAVHWLDLARYADTHGYHLDAGREQWPWRDWVIEAFNRNLAFDQFVTWQLAGDLLPNATIEQKLATGFVRNNMVNFEGGAIAEEYLAAYIKDRVSTVGTVFLGLTVACAECHDHKFDPVSQRDYYQLYAYFNSVPEKGLDGSQGNAAPLLELPVPAELQRKLDELAGQIQATEKEIAALAPAADTEQTHWEQTAINGSTQQGIPKEITQILTVLSEKRTDEQRKQLTRYYREKVSPTLRAPTARLAQLQQQLNDEQKKRPTVMVMQEMEKPRDSFILVRGQYNAPGEKVAPALPAALGPVPADAPQNRLALAKWLTDPRHPLMARVTANRFWKNVMGTGIVKTVNDFGSQGEWPKHPELLDWLACEFVESGWDVKHLVRLIVSSAAYQQSANVSRELLERDPDNRLHARGPRFRLSAEEVRDTALAVSGLLIPKIGGPSVYPYQPPGLWEELNSRDDSRKWTAQFFEQSHGPDLYRRSLYTFWKRTSPPPQMLTFDAPDREVCTASRERTNTPLQALVTLNETGFVEASRKLAERAMREGGATSADRARFAFRMATARLPNERELVMLTELFDKAKSRFAPQPDQAVKLLSIGEIKRDETLDPAELAAWTMVASTILNLDETLTKG